MFVIVALCALALVTSGTAITIDSAGDNCSHIKNSISRSSIQAETIAHSWLTNQGIVVDELTKSNHMIEAEQRSLSLAMGIAETEQYDMALESLLDNGLALAPNDNQVWIPQMNLISDDPSSIVPNIDDRSECASGEDFTLTLFEALGENAAPLTSHGPVSLIAIKNHVQDSLKHLTPIAKTVVLVRFLAKRKHALIESTLVNTWLKKHKTLTNLIKSYTVPRVIAFSCPNKYFRLVLHQIRCIREIYKSTIPIEVYHIGYDDLADHRIARLKSQPNVSVIDITTVFSNAELGLSGWDSKPFVMLASAGREVLLLDADAVLAKNPESFFEYPPYINAGALFFKDRYFGNRPSFGKWLQGIMPGISSDIVYNNPMSTNQSAYYQDSGAVLIRKHGRQFWSLLIAALLNGRRHRPELYSQTHGDKESYWIGAMAMNAPTSWGPQPAGQCGIACEGEGSYRSTNRSFYGKLCHNLAHFDRDMRLWWMNDGLVADKHDSQSGLRLPRHGAVASEGKWENVCIRGTIHPLPSDQIELFNRMAPLFENSV